MPLSPIEHFVQRARLGWTLWLILEQAAVGLLVGSILALPLVLILLFREQSGLQLSIILPAIGILGGAIVGYRNRPSSLATVVHADKCLQAAELLSTAWLSQSSSDAWNSTILMLANARCRGLSPAVVVPHHLGRRGWSAVALSISAILTLGLFSTTQRDSRADAVTVSSSPTSTIWPELAPSAVGNNAHPSIEPKAERAPDSGPITGGSTLQPVQSLQTDFAKSALDRSRSSDPSGEGTSGGNGQTKGEQPKSPNQTPSVDGNKSVSSPNGPAFSGGSGRPNTGQSTADSKANGDVSPNAFTPVAPWAATGWSDDQSRAAQEIRSSHVPDAYREMIRDYFNIP